MLMVEIRSKMNKLVFTNFCLHRERERERERFELQRSQMEVNKYKVSYKILDK